MDVVDDNAENDAVRRPVDVVVVVAAAADEGEWAVHRYRCGAAAVAATSSCDGEKDDDCE